MMAPYPQSVVIQEQGLRDGIQNENKLLSTDLKIDLIRQLLAAGLTHLEVTSFVHPRFVPQMADAEKVCAAIQGFPGGTFSALVLNTKGLKRALKTGVPWVAASISASEAHSRANVNQTLDEARGSLKKIVCRGKGAGVSIRGGVQCAFGCRLQGGVDPELVLEMVREQLEWGVDEITLADSTGMAHPGAIEDLGGRVRELAAGRPVWLHLHDTEGRGLANALAGLQVGIRHFDTAFGGLGGCPFIKGASGNIASEDFLVMLHWMGITTGIDVARVAAVSRQVEAVLEKPLAGKIHRLVDRGDLKVLL